MAEWAVEMTFGYLDAVQMSRLIARSAGNNFQNTVAICRTWGVAVLVSLSGSYNPDALYGT